MSIRNFSISNEILGESFDKRIIYVLRNGHVPNEYFKNNQILIVQCGFVMIYLEDENGRKEIIDFKNPGDILRTKPEISKEKLSQMRGMALEYSEILIL